MCVASNDLCIWDLDNKQNLGARLAAAQRNMEKTIIGVSRQDQRTKEWIRRKTKVRDIIHVIKARKWTWAGHIARIQDNRWTSQVTDWRPMDGSRPSGRPSNRWKDEIDAFWRCVTWKQNAQDRLSWKSKVRPLSKKWINNG